MQGLIHLLEMVHVVEMWFVTLGNKIMTAKRAEETAQWVKLLLYKPESLSSGPQNPWETMCVCTCNLSDGEMMTAGCLGLTVHPAQ